jgi:hypothetical protein
LSTISTAQGNLEMIGEKQDHVAAWVGASRLDKAQVARRNSGVERQLQLTMAARLAPLAQQTAKSPLRAFDLHEGVISEDRSQIDYIGGKWRLHAGGFIARWQSPAG